MATATRRRRGSKALKELKAQEGRRSGKPIKAPRKHKRRGYNPEAEGVTVRGMKRPTDPTVKLLTCAARGDEKAQRKLRSLSPEQRRQIADQYCHGLRGRTRVTFIEEGLTLREQSEKAKAARLNRELLHEVNHNRKGTMKANRTKKSKKQSPIKPLPAGHVGAKELAKAAKVTPKELRSYLRAKGIGKTNGRYAWKSLKDRKALAIIKGVKAAA